MTEIFIYPGPIPTHCPMCGGQDDGTVRIRRQPTAFAQNHLNFMTCCEACQKQNNLYWQERWDEYYREMR